MSGALPAWADALVAALLVAGALFTLIGSFALVKLSDFFKRVRGPTKASTLGIGCAGLASAVAFSAGEGPLVMHALLLVIFVFLTAPVSAHLLVSAAMRVAMRDAARARPASSIRTN